MKRTFSKLLLVTAVILVLISSSASAFAASAVAQKTNPTGARVTPTLIGGIGDGGYSQYQGGVGLSDGTRVNEWLSANVFYWQYAGDYVEFSIPKTVNIYRSGTTSWVGYTNQLKIKRKNSDGSYTDVSTQYNLPTASVTESQWNQFISALPSGTYRFEWVSGLRLDSEWYMEDASPPAPDPVVPLLLGRNSVNSRVNIVNYSGAMQIKQSLILPYSYAIVKG